MRPSLAWLALMVGCAARPQASTPARVVVDDRDAGPHPVSFDTPIDDYADTRRWIDEHAIALDTVEAGHGFDDMAPFAEVIGDARVVALGEATHGTREFFQLKHRMLEYLVTQLGFTVFAIEASMPEAFAVNEYVLHGKGDARKLVTSLLFWTWNTEEVLAMIEWMRDYNRDPEHVDKVKFYGFEQSAPVAVAHVLAYLDRVDGRAARRARRTLDVLLDPFELWREHDWTIARLSGVVAGARSLTKTFARHRGAWQASSGGDAFELAAQHARVLEQFVDNRVGFSVPTRLQQAAAARGHAQATNIQWILERERGAKMVVWASNAAVATSGSWPVGAELRRALGDDLVVFGLAFDQGGFRARDDDDALYPIRDYTVGPAGTGSLEAMLASAGPPIFALDLRDVPVEGEVADWFDRPHQVRSIGVHSARIPQSFPEIARERYDAFLFVARTTAARSVDPQPSTQLSSAQENLDFEGGTEGGVPMGWRASNRIAAFDLEATAVACPRDQGGHCGTIRSTAPHATVDYFGTLTQLLAPAPYHGKRVRVHALVRADVRGTGNRAYLYVQLRLPRGSTIHSSGTFALPISTAWKTETIELYVPPAAHSLSYGIALVGDGQAWIDDVSVEIVEG